jgi:phosphoglycerate dehydrogenase-like enzyme
MKIVFQNQGLISGEYKKFFLDNLPKNVELIFTEHRDPETFMEHINDMDIFVGYSLSEELIAHAVQLKHIQVPWTGFNTLDDALLKNYKGTISNSHSNSLAIAEHAFALLTSAAKLLTQRDAGMRKHDWSTRNNETNSFWITGKTLGIIGYGAIGKKVAKIAKFGFDMNVMAIKRTKTKEEKDLDFLGNMNDLDYILKNSDYILVAVPQTSETIDLISENEFNQMKNSAILVNIARGPIVNEKALYEALKNEKIGAAGIDVWYNYPKGGDSIIEQNYPFEKLNNIVMTPHSAFKVRDRVEVFAADILENLKLVINENAPINQVNLELGY